jgi:hypothetical protein
MHKRKWFKRLISGTVQFLTSCPFSFGLRFSERSVNSPAVLRIFIPPRQRLCISGNYTLSSEASAYEAYGLNGDLMFWAPDAFAWSSPCAHGSMYFGRPHLGRVLCTGVEIPSQMPLVSGGCDTFRISAPAEKPCVPHSRRSQFSLIPQQ